MRTYKTVAISMPPALYDEIVAQAAELGLSVSAYIRYRLAKAPASPPYGLECEEVITNGRED